MLVSVLMTVGLLVQASGNARPIAVSASTSRDSVHLWRSDSIAYVALPAPGHLMVLHVDAGGRIEVIFPEAPWDSTAVSADAPVAIELPPEAQGSPGTFLAIRSRWRFNFEGLRDGIEWNYQGALLLQPTAADPLGALFDIADRVTAGRPYDYGVVTYSREGAVVQRGPVEQPNVCWSCYRRAPPVAAAAAAAPSTNSVDCSNAALTNAFCGVNSGSVSFAMAPPAPPQVIYQPAPVMYTYVPLYPGLFWSTGRSRFDRPVPTMRAAVSSAFGGAPRLSVPTPSVLGRRP